MTTTTTTVFKLSVFLRSSRNIKGREECCSQCAEILLVCEWWRATFMFFHSLFYHVRGREGTSARRILTRTTKHKRASVAAYYRDSVLPTDSTSCTVRIQVMKHENKKTHYVFRSMFYSPDFIWPLISNILLTS